MGKFQVIDHPLIQHKLTIIRDKNSGTKVFREVVDEIAMLMAYEISRDLPVEEVEIETPMMKSVQKQLAGKKVAIIPILRAGLGMVDGILQLIPAAKVGHVGLYRDEETLEPHSDPDYTPGSHVLGFYQRGATPCKRRFEYAILYWWNFGSDRGWCRPRYSTSN